MNAVAQGPLSLPEVLQLALPPVEGHLRPGVTDLTVATIIDLALMGRIVSTPARWGFSYDARLNVVDDTPIGNEPLDYFLGALAARRKPKTIMSSILKFGVSAETRHSLVSRGAVDVHGTPEHGDCYLEPLDVDLRNQCVEKLGTARTSNDPRSMALLDIRCWSAWGWTPVAGQLMPPIQGSYPKPAAAVVRGALHSLFTATGREHARTSGWKKRGVKQ